MDGGQQCREERGPEPAAQAGQVVLLHGILMTSVEMWLLGHRLRRQGFAVRYFSYASVRRTPAENARRLQAWLTAQPRQSRHFVAHSLGGLVLMHLFEQYPDQPPGRVVMLGSPVAGSQLARRLVRVPFLRRLFARGMPRGLDGKRMPAWPPGRDWGMLAGDRPRGIGLLLGGLPGANDGTVTVAETHHPAQKAHQTVAAGHTGLVFSRRAARLVTRFLRRGAF